MSKIIYFRVDCSFSIGSGHLKRCLTIAEHFKKLKYKIIFLTKFKNIEFEKLNKKFSIIYINKFISYKNEPRYISKKINKLQKNIIIVDKYELDIIWYNNIKKFFHKVVVIDDFANKKYNCDILINQNYGYSHKNFKNLVPKHSKFILSPRFNLINDKVYDLVEKSLIYRKKKSFKNISISFGASDTNNHAIKILNLLKKIQTIQNYNINLYLGSNSKNYSIYKKFNKYLNLKIYRDNSLYLKNIIKNDLVIGSAGVSLIERCILGIPSILLNDSENQNIASKYFIREKLTFKITHINSSSSLEKKINQIFNKKNYFKFALKLSKIYKQNNIISIIQLILT